PNFDADVGGWGTVPFGTGGSVVECEWDGGTDVDGNAASGALECHNVWPTASDGIGGFQCLPVSTSTEYDVIASALTASAQPVTGSAAISVQWWSAPGCSTPAGGVVLSFPTAAGWSQIVETLTTPATAASVRFGLTVLKDSGPETFAVHFDDIRFGPTGTVTVELQAFSVEWRHRPSHRRPDGRTWQPTSPVPIRRRRTAASGCWRRPPRHRAA